MITKISKLKNFGIFHEFTWENELPNFEKFNLIYGWNGSGKTTISRVFASCEKKCTDDEFYPRNGEFEIKITDGNPVKHTNVDNNVLPIKVFNQDFIDENISFDPSDSCNSIVYVSEEDIEKKSKLESLKDKIDPLSNEHDKSKQERKNAKKIEDNFRIAVAQTITSHLTDKKERDRYFSYNKSKVKDKINTIGIDNFAEKKLPDEETRKYKELSKSEKEDTQEVLSECRIDLNLNGETIDSFQKIFEKVENLICKKVVSETLDRLKDDQDLNNWVKQGFDLHKTKEEKDTCLFCQEPLKSDFLDSLSKHFSEDYEELQNTITQLKDKILNIKKRDTSTENPYLYPNLKDKYTEKAKKIDECIRKRNTWIDEAVGKLQEKYDSPLEVISSPTAPEDFLALYNKNIKELNKIINEHNEKVKNHSAEVSNAKEKLELHLIAIALEAQNYKKMVTDSEKALKKEKEASEVREKNNSKIAELEKQTSNIGKAIEEINKNLKDFFSREEIKLELDEDKKGYTIKRNRKPAKNLSEGEKTAIAFSYFIVKVGESDFDKSKGIIFIDDPVSSFDSNFIYHCFSIISTHFKEVGQLFISTHNFQLFNLMKNWFIGKNKKRKRKSKNKNKCCEFFMIENFTELNVRKAKIIKLDKTLQNYKSEYHFLFAKLKNFSEKQDVKYEDSYTIGNIARRFFEIFSDFKIPTTGDQKSKMDVLINNSNEKISEVEATKAYKLVNEFSHNSDPTSTIEHKDKSEIKKAIKILLRIVENSDIHHYQGLMKSYDRHI